MTRALKLAVACIAALITAVVTSPAQGGSANFSLVCTNAQAGAPLPCTILRVDATSGTFVLVETGDGTAKAGTDYTAVKQLVYMPPGQLTFNIAVPTLVNPAATGNLSLIVAMAASPKDVLRTSGTIAAATPAAAWVDAPLHDGGFAQVTAVSDPKFEIAGPGVATRTLVPGEMVAIYFNGGQYTADNKVAYSVYALSDGASGRALASDLKGMAPSGNPPLPPPNLGLPSDWWVPGLVKANQNCPQITQGSTYRAAMASGTHHSLATGTTGMAGVQWVVFAADDPWMGARVMVDGSCLTGA